MTWKGHHQKLEHMTPIFTMDFVHLAWTCIQNLNPPKNRSMVEKRKHGELVSTRLENYSSRSLPQGSEVKFQTSLKSPSILWMCFIPLYTVSSTYSFQTITNNHHQRSLAESWAFWLFFWQVKVSPPDLPDNDPPKTYVEGDPNGVILQWTQRLFAKRVKHNMTYY